MTNLTTEFANVSLDLIGPGGMATDTAHLVCDIRNDAEIAGALHSVQAVEDRFIVGVTGGFTEETF